MCALETAALELLPSNQPPASSSSSSGGASSGTSANGASANGNVNQQVVVDNEGSYGIVTEESVQKTIDSLEDVMQKDFIRKCLNKNPEDRPTARELLFHPVLFEVHSLKLLAAHILVNTPGESFFTFCVLKDLLG